MLGIGSQLQGGRGAAVVAVYLASLWLPTAADISLYLLILLAVWAVWVTSSEPPSAFLAGPDPWVLLFLLSMALAVLASSDWHRSLTLSAGFIPASLCYLLLTRYTSEPHRLVWVFLGHALLSIAVASAVILAFVRHGMDEGPDATQTLIDQTGLSLLVVPNDVLLLALNVPLTVALILVWRNAAAATIGIASLGASLVAVVLLQSRAATLGILIGVAVMGIAASKRRILAYLALAVVAIAAIDALLGFPLLHKFTSICSNREPLWAAAWSLFLESPALGHGPFTFKNLYLEHLPATGWFGCELQDPRITPWPHNLYLELLASHGLLGALAFLTILVWTVRTHWRLLQGADADSTCRTIAGGLAGGFCAFVAAAVFELSFIRFWVVVWLAVLVAATAALQRCYDRRIDAATALSRGRRTRVGKPKPAVASRRRRARAGGGE
jgi:O-antigen ligase